MARIPKTPSVATFVETWTQDFKAAVTTAAGKDGRLSVSEAKKLAAKAGPEHVFGDNALSALTATGRKTVSVAQVTTEMQAYAERAAKAVAGRDGKITLGEGAKLPADLVEDFFMLRGKSVPGTGTPTSDLAQVKTSLEAATADLLMPSETDAKFAFVSGQPLAGAPITADLVRAQLTAQHDATIGSLMYVDPSEVSLAAKTTVEERDANAFFTDLSTNVDPNDPASVARGQQFAALKQTLDANLTDLKVYRFGTVSISTFVVGRTKTGELAGLLTGQVET
jgi:hypothetical protein